MEKEIREGMRMWRGGRGGRRGSQDGERGYAARMGRGKAGQREGKNSTPLSIKEALSKPDHNKSITMKVS